MTDTTLPSLAYLALGGTIASVSAGHTADRAGAVPRLDANDLLAAVPAIAGVAHVDARQLGLIPSPSLDFADVQRALDAAHEAIAAGAAGVVVSQGTDTIEETAYLLDLAWGRPEPLVVTGAMRHSTSPGADGPANLLAAACVAADPGAHGRGVLVVLNDEIHGAGTVRKTHTFSTATFASPGTGPLGWVAEGTPIFRSPAHQLPALTDHVAALPPVALHRVSLADDGRTLGVLGDLGYRGAVIEGFGGGHVAENNVAAVRELTRRMPVVLASRTGSGETLAGTYGFAGSEIDLLAAGLIPAGHLDGLKSRLLLASLLSLDASRDRMRAEFLQRGRGAYPVPRS